MRTTGKFDIKNQEVFEGDKIIHAWGWFNWEGKIRVMYRIHTIVARGAYMMANGEMHDDGGGVIFCMGKSYNFWKGEEVQKLTNNEVKEIGMSDDVDFFINDENKAIKFTDQQFMGLSDEDWQKELNRRKKFEYDFFFGRKYKKNV